MAESAAENETQFKAQKKSAFIVGHTGESGKALLKEILTRGVFSRVVVIGRREVKYEDELYKDVEQKIVDFDKLDEHAEAFQGIDVGFCCIGTTTGAGTEMFRRVDHDYVVNTAKLAKEGGCTHFQLLSSVGANKNSFFLYQKTKGEAEEDVKPLDFARCTIFRPGLLLCKRTESRPRDSFYQFMFKPMAKISPTSGSIATTVLATAMVNCAIETGEGIEIFENKPIHKLAKPEKKKQCC